MIRDRITRCVDSLDPLLNGLGALGASNEGKHTYRFNRCLAYSLMTAVLLMGLCTSSWILGNWCSGVRQSFDEILVLVWGSPLKALVFYFIRLPLLWFLTAGLCAAALGIRFWKLRRVTKPGMRPSAPLGSIE